MTGGASAATQAEVSRRLADELERRVADYRQMAENYASAAASERRLEQTLSPLRNQGFHVLADRRWPGSARAQVDFLVVGPAGVFIVDAKSWRDVRIQDAGGHTRIFQGDDDVTDRFDSLSSLHERIVDILAEVGLAPGEIHTLAVFTNRSDIRAAVNGVELLSEVGAVDRILRAGRRLPTGEIERVLMALMEACPPHTGSEIPTSVIVTAPPAAPVEEPTPDDPPALLTIEEVWEAAHAGLSAEPIEAWMAFLHPEQIKVVRRSFSGPSRIRGAAGTGKTVVGLHRAAHLARTRSGRVLVTTFVKTLPAVLGQLFRRLAPDVVDRVDFRGVYDLAGKVLAARGVRNRLDGGRASAIWLDVWRRHGATGAVGAIDPDDRYWSEEIERVIKGRGLLTLADYEECSRVGRQRGLTLAQRAAVWDLYARYQAALDAAQVWDYADVILRAVDAAEGLETPYTSVVIDEAQDLSAAMIRLLHLLVGDEPDAFNLIGDGQQSIYPGGYTLAELGVSIAGRGVVMTRNYRNTRQISEFAASLVGDGGFIDIESGSVATTDAADVVREGADPVVVRFRSGRDRDGALLARVRELLAEPGIHAGDIALLALYRRQATTMLALLADAGIPAIDLEKYDGRTVSAVKVGTIKRAKGLEFKHVLVPHTPARVLSPTRGTGEDERSELERRELYVAMTRARDGLWVGVVAA